jgi:D-3-phosphoglycerate dehydrogenase
MSETHSFPKDKIKILLLENVHQAAVSRLKEAGYAVKEIGKALGSEELMEEMADAHVVGIRSKTKITAEHIQNAKRLLTIGCFGVGTNQVDLSAATDCGVPVFNAPFGNTRSVAELAIGNLIALARKMGDVNNKMHSGQWSKSAKGSIEIRHKTLGVVGFGHIGQQVGVMAEALGMNVIFYDKVRRLALGNARQVETMDALLAESDFISLHVPAMPGGKALIGQKEFSMMKKGSYVLNASRGSLIDFNALKEAISSKHLGGAALDVFPDEPKTNEEAYDCGLCGVENILLTPHIGGSTEEAQLNIGLEVAATFTKFIDEGATAGSVNFPQIDLTANPETHRILNVHRNEPGALSAVNNLVSELGVNIDSQHLGTFKNIGYLVMDVNREVSDEFKNKLSALPNNIKTRILY